MCASLTLEDLDPDIRVKLEQESEENLWSEISEKGFSEVAEELDIPRSRLYNWKHKQEFIPVKLPRKVLNEFEIAGFKGGSRSHQIDWRLPKEISDELLTRISLGTSVNKECTPVYYTKDSGLKDRFCQLLEQYDVSYREYSRSGFEVRFPTAVYRVLDDMVFQRDKIAVLDERGELKGDRIVYQDFSEKIEEVEDEVYSVRLRLAIAVRRGESFSRDLF